MTTFSKRFEGIKKKVDRVRFYELDEALRIAKENATAKFDETVELTMRLGVDPRHADQMVRGTVVLPNGIGKQVRVLAFAAGDKEKEARDAGADYVGVDEYVEKITGGWLDFDAAVATPDLMGKVGRLGKVLGPRGLMPNPKTGTVTFDIIRAIREIKAGKIEYRVDKGGNIHAPCGKASFDMQKLQENAMAIIESVIKAKPAASKGVYLRSIGVSTTMGVGIRLDPVKIANIYKH